MNKFVEKEIERIYQNFDFGKALDHSSILITGGTGLIGSTIVRYLSYLKKKDNFDIQIYAMARNEKKVKSLDFAGNISWIYKTLDDDLDNLSSVDYIIHTASPTDSKYFIEKPVETINSTIHGLNNLMIFASKSNTKGFVFLSSMEAYGICCDDKYLKENEYYSIDSTNVRNSYSEGKKILECLACSYASEYNVPVKIVRLCQTFGPGVTLDDNRVFAQFARAVTNGQDITLSTKGETKRSYCSLVDATSGILTVLLHGKVGQAYNIASDDSYYSIYQMAEFFIKNTSQKIVIQEKNDNKYLPTIKFGLETSKAKTIGFKSIDSMESIVNTFKEYYDNLLKGIVD